MSVNISTIDNSVINAYTERCSRFSENVRKLQEQIQQFKQYFFGEETEQHVVQEPVVDSYAAYEQPVVESFSANTPYQASTSKEHVLPEDIDIDALVNEIANTAVLEI